VNPSGDALRQRFGDAVLRVTESNGATIAVIEAAGVAGVLGWLKTTPGQEYDYLADLTAVEHRDAERPIEVVYQLFSIPRSTPFRVKALLPKDRPLELDTVVPLWRGADWMEREVYDMFGVRFEGHPDLRRILLPDAFTAYPLRKDYPLQGRGERHNFPVLQRATS